MGDTCPCVDENTEACSYGEHGKCDERTIPHMCGCMCHYMNVGERFGIGTSSWLKTGPKTFVRM